MNSNEIHKGTVVFGLLKCARYDLHALRWPLLVTGSEKVRAYKNGQPGKHLAAHGDGCVDGGTEEVLDGGVVVEVLNVQHSLFCGCWN